ncbi:MAG: hypothetical protein ACRDSL_11700 [Pseudonocardiaceae bacterium]
MTDRAQRVTPRPLPVQRHHRPADIPAQQRRTAAQPGRSADAVRTKPVRRSVDLSPTYHTQLTQWCAETADEIGATRVTGQDVLRALVARLLVDQALARRIRADLSIDSPGASIGPGASIAQEHR